MGERLLTGHAAGDVVHVDWHDGGGPVDAAVVLSVLPGELCLRFRGETRDRYFTRHDSARGLWLSEKGQVVEVGRDV